MTVAGRKIEIIEKDSQVKPDVGRNLLAEAYGDDNVELAVGGTSVRRGPGHAAGRRKRTRRS